MAYLAEKYLAQGHSRLAVKDVEQSVKVLVDAMTRALARGQRIEIRGLKQKASKANEQLPQRQRRELHAHHTAPKGQ